MKQTHHDNSHPRENGDPVLVSRLRGNDDKKKFLNGIFFDGGRRETRTLMILRSLAPEASVSTSSTIRPNLMWS